MPPLAGGAIGYVGYDCVRYFEPRTARPLKDVLKVPEALFMLFDTIVAFDHFFQVVRVISYLYVPPSELAQGNGAASAPPGSAAPATASLASAYDAAAAIIRSVLDTLLSPEPAPLPDQPAIVPDQKHTSNIGREGYEAHVRKLKEHISHGDIIQAVPSQRFARPTSLHPFNIYRQLRIVNPSPYLLYVSCEDFALVGASPELLVKASPAEDEEPFLASSPPPSAPSPSTTSSTPPSFSSSSHPTIPTAHGRTRIITHPIAGTAPRSAHPATDAALATALRSSPKDRAEHVMLVDLARNDVNRVGEPCSVRVDFLMAVHRFSHVQHLVSQVSGTLRQGADRFAAFRSIFPAGTVSGAPKVRAMQLVAECEGEKRGVYAGAVGYWGYDTLAVEARGSGGGGDGSARGADATGDGTAAPASQGKTVVRRPGAMDTCIALRTMVVRDGVAYLQAGGGIVWDSEPYDEWVETINKLGAGVQCIERAEARHGGGGIGCGVGFGDWKSKVEGWDEGRERTGGDGAGRE